MRALVVDRDPTYRIKVGTYLAVNGFENVDTIDYYGLANTRLRRGDQPFLVVANVSSYYNSTWDIIGNMRNGIKTVAVLDRHDVSNAEYSRARRADAYVSRYAYLILLGHNILQAIGRPDHAPAGTGYAQAPHPLSRRGAEVLPFRSSRIFA